MRFLKSLRWLLVLAVLAPIVPASAHASVFISVGFAPPPLLVYAQPPCPEPGWMWIPGYWAYGPDGYYWVPGTWVPAPYLGALWTPGYWGWSAGLYIWHPGYWARRVGYYGGINYGFGYFGIGFVGGRWRGDRFMYNTAVMRVGPGFRNTYMDRNVVRRNTIANDRHIAYNGGPNGIRHAPSRQERRADREQHMGRTQFQNQHVDAAMRDRGAYFNNNHGRPPVVTQQRPMGPGARDNRGGENPMYQNGRTTQQRAPRQVEPQPQSPQRPEYQQRQERQQQQVDRPQQRQDRQQQVDRPQQRQDRQQQQVDRPQQRQDRQQQQVDRPQQRQDRQQRQVDRPQQRQDRQQPQDQRQQRAAGRGHNR